MKTIFIKDQNFIPLPDKVCAAIGNFDGVHLGHQKLIYEAKRHDLKSAVITFYPHPSVFLKKIPNYPLVTPLEHKQDIIARMGIDYLIVIEFDLDLAMMSKEKFIENLKFMNIDSLVCGYDFTFARFAEGDINDLRKHFNVYEIKKFVFDNVRVSTTYIRELLASGNVSDAGRLLGRNYSVRGKVKFGSQSGRMIGFPTANIDYRNYFLPQNGVYFVSVSVLGTPYLGMCNIGHNPTFNFSDAIRMEVHIFNFDDDIYDDIVEVSFIKKIRNEMKFTSIDELVSRLKNDKDECLRLAGKMYLTK